MKKKPPKKKRPGCDTGAAMKQTSISPTVLAKNGGDASGEDSHSLLDSTSKVQRVATSADAAVMAGATSLSKSARKYERRARRVNHGNMKGVAIK
jgi:hypothetical protein